MQEISEINQIVDLSKDVSGTGEIKQSKRSTLSETNRNYNYWGTCWNYDEFGHLAYDYQSSELYESNTPATNSLKNVKSGLQFPQTTS